MARKPGKKLDLASIEATGECVSKPCGRPLFGAPPFCPFCGTPQPQREPEAPPKPPAPDKVEPKLPKPAEPSPPPGDKAAPKAPTPVPVEITAAVKAKPAPAEKLRAAPPAPPAPPAPAIAADEPARPIVRRPPVKPRNYTWLWITGGVVILFFLIMRGCGSSTPSPPPAPTLVTQYVSRTVKVRAGPGGSQLLVGELGRGQEARGEWVTGLDGQTPWLKLSAGPYAGQFVWGRNLAGLARPEITASFPAAQTALSAGDVRAEPDPTSNLVAQLAPGDVVSVQGVTGDGWTELALKVGGVGYARSTLFQTAPAAIPAPGDLAAASDAAAAAAATAAAAAPNAVATGQRQYACAFSPAHSSNPVPGARTLTYSVEESQSCVNGRTVYLRLPDGALLRGMLSNEDNRASFAGIAPDRRSFTRDDYFLSPEAFRSLSDISEAQVRIACGGADPQAAQAQLRATTNRLIGALRNVPKSRSTTWTCAPAAP